MRLSPQDVGNFLFKDKIAIQCPACKSYANVLLVASGNTYPKSTAFSSTADIRQCVSCNRIWEVAYIIEIAHCILKEKKPDEMWWYLLNIKTNNPYSSRYYYHKEQAADMIVEQKWTGIYEVRPLSDLTLRQALETFAPQSSDFNAKILKMCSD